MLIVVNISNLSLTHYDPLTRPTTGVTSSPAASFPDAVDCEDEVRHEGSESSSGLPLRKSSTFPCLVGPAIEHAVQVRHRDPSADGKVQVHVAMLPSCSNQAEVKKWTPSWTAELQPA